MVYTRFLKAINVRPIKKQILTKWRLKIEILVRRRNGRCRFLQQIGKVAIIELLISLSLLLLDNLRGLLLLTSRRRSSTS